MIILHYCYEIECHRCYAKSKIRGHDIFYDEIKKAIIMKRYES